MKLSFEIPANRVQEIINCIQQESELDKRINSFEMMKLDCYDGGLKEEIFRVEIISDNAFFIKRMAEAAREKTKEEKELEKYYENSDMARIYTSLRKQSQADVKTSIVELEHYDETAISQEEQDGRTE
jgi:hypothetical protein